MLVYSGPYKRSRRKDFTFDAWDNVGAYVIIDVLERAGIEVEFCTPETAHLFDVVLVSLTSPYDLFNFAAATGIYTTWQKDRRKFRVIAGGAGLQNIAPVRDLVDYAVFGRAEGFAADMVKSIAQGKDFDHPSVMPLREEIRSVTYAQAERPYPHPVKVGTFVFQEEVVGCPLSCDFCHYTYSRKWMGGQASEYVRDGQYQGSAEGLFVNSANMLKENPQSRIITGLDGLSQRLRYAFNKRISNETVINVFEQATEGEGRTVFYKLYMIGAYPTESDVDMSEFYETMNRVKSAGRQLRIKVHLTPFQASPLTPGAYLPVNINKPYYELGGKTIARSDNKIVWWSPAIDSPAMHLLGMIAARSTEVHADVLDMVIYNKRFQAARVEQKMDSLLSFNIDDFIREYKATEPLPTWYLCGYRKAETIIRASTRLKANLRVNERG